MQLAFHFKQRGVETMEWLKLIGIVIIIVGFLVKIDTIAVILIAAIATGVSIRDGLYSNISYFRKSVRRSALSHIIRLNFTNGRAY